jgi:hypothetical protein
LRSAARIDYENQNPSIKDFATTKTNQFVDSVHYKRTIIKK